MRRIPDSRLQASLTEFVGREIAVCQCGGILDFGTDLNGHVIESCSKCHIRQQMTCAKPRPIENLPVPVLTYPCECGATIAWMGGGPKRRRCNACSVRLQRAASKEWERRHKRWVA